MGTRGSPPSVAAASSDAATRARSCRRTPERSLQGRENEQEAKASLLAIA
jgi:hypothetical protein